MHKAHPTVTQLVPIFRDRQVAQKAHAQTKTCRQRMPAQRTVDTTLQQIDREIIEDYEHLAVTAKIPGKSGFGASLAGN